jgi:dipeptidase E
LRQALDDLLGKPFASANIVYVPTASVAEPGDHGWFKADSPGTSSKVAL